MSSGSIANSHRGQNGASISVLKQRIVDAIDKGTYQDAWVLAMTPGTADKCQFGLASHFMAHSASKSRRIPNKLYPHILDRLEKSSDHNPSHTLQLIRGLGAFPADANTLGRLYAVATNTITACNDNGVAYDEKFLAVALKTLSSHFSPTVSNHPREKLALLSAISKQLSLPNFNNGRAMHVDDMMHIISLLGSGFSSDVEEVRVLLRHLTYALIPASQKSHGVLSKEKIFLGLRGLQNMNIIMHNEASDLLSVLTVKIRESIAVDKASADMPAQRGRDIGSPYFTWEIVEKCLVALRPMDTRSKAVRELVGLFSEVIRTDGPGGVVEPVSAARVGSMLASLRFLPGSDFREIRTLFVSIVEQIPRHEERPLMDLTSADLVSYMRSLRHMSSDYTEIQAFLGKMATHIERNRESHHSAPNLVSISATQFMQLLSVCRHLSSDHKVVRRFYSAVSHLVDTEDFDTTGLTPAAVGEAAIGFNRLSSTEPVVQELLRHFVEIAGRARCVSHPGLFAAEDVFQPAHIACMLYGCRALSLQQQRRGADPRSVQAVHRLLTEVVVPVLERYILSTASVDSVLHSEHVFPARLLGMAMYGLRDISNVHPCPDSSCNGDSKVSLVGARLFQCMGVLISRASNASDGAILSSRSANSFLTGIRNFQILDTTNGGGDEGPIYAGLNSNLVVDSICDALEGGGRSHHTVRGGVQPYVSSAHMVGSLAPLRHVRLPAESEASTADGSGVRVAKRLLGVLADEVVKPCKEPLNNPGDVGRCMAFLRSISSEHDEAQKLIGAIAGKLPVFSSAPRAVSLSRSPYWREMHQLGNDEPLPEGPWEGSWVQGFGGLPRSLSADMAPRDMGNILTGLQSCRSEHAAVQDLLEKLTQWLQQNHGDLSYDGRTMRALRHLRHLGTEGGSRESGAVLGFLAVVAPKIEQYHEARGKLAGDSPQGGQQLWHPRDSRPGALDLAMVSGALCGLGSVRMDATTVDTREVVMICRVLGGLMEWCLDDHSDAPGVAKCAPNHLTRPMLVECLSSLCLKSDEFPEIRKLVGLITHSCDRYRNWLQSQNPDSVPIAMGFSELSECFAGLSSMIGNSVELDDLVRVVLLPQLNHQTPVDGSVRWSEVVSIITGIRHYMLHVENKRTVGEIFRCINEKVGDSQSMHNLISDEGLAGILVVLGQNGTPMDNIPEMARFLRLVGNSVRVTSDIRSLVMCIHGLRNVSNISSDVLVFVGVLCDLYDHGRGSRCTSSGPTGDIELLISMFEGLTHLNPYVHRELVGLYGVVAEVTEMMLCVGSSTVEISFLDYQAIKELLQAHEGAWECQYEDNAAAEQHYGEVKQLTGRISRLLQAHVSR